MLKMKLGGNMVLVFFDENMVLVGICCFVSTLNPWKFTSREPLGITFSKSQKGTHGFWTVCPIESCNSLISNRSLSWTRFPTIK